MKKVVSILMLLSMILLSCLPAFALEETGLPSGPQKAKQVGDCKASISKSGTTVTVVGYFFGSSINKGTIKLELQKKNGSSYQTVKTWSKTITGSSGAYSEKKVISPTATYRLKATFTLYSSSGSQTYVKYAS